jgi:hypothetical protein
VALCLCVDGVVTMILRRRERSVKGVYVRADL